MNSVGIHLIHAPVLHPISEGLFNFVIGWTFMFAPLLFTDRNRNRYKPNTEHTPKKLGTVVAVAVTVAEQVWWWLRWSEIRVWLERVERERERESRETLEFLLYI
ncbi:hypothetical protein L1987_43440 [Smallanthus sonchifolius]|uniref:Uncharacterized protein n=1 Tax=Smallanthus sonchifolius TaxID=185202 RepID=A0ACB9GLL5_9ASTR|nr:hypothetical protein L1987_43440 [Smallanthus sonchifolius]